MKPLVLVIENDRGTRKLLDVLLSRLGLAVDLVATGSDALLLLEQVEYDCAFIDLLLPGLSGADVLQWIAANRPSLLQRSIVLSSATPAQLDRVRERWPAVRTIRKPFELSEVVTVAQEALTRPQRSPEPRVEFTRHSVTAGAKAGIVMRLDGEHLSPALSFGYSDAAVQAFMPLRLDEQLPICEAARQGRPLWLPSLGAVSVTYPQLAPIWEKNESRALAAVPL
ncbi:MAG: response regulator, partial [Acidobacteriota bacterium]|nr:response regulator [Acidobacteriota bacterium]